MDYFQSRLFRVPRLCRLASLVAAAAFFAGPGHADTRLYEVRELSNPAGLIPARTTEYSEEGEVHRVHEFSVVSGNHRFGFWTFNGVRQEFPSGQAYLYPEIEVTEDIEAVAHFFPVDEDGDGDRLADWWEFWMFGDRSRGPQDDDDGDGVPHETEFRYGYSAQFKDDIADGGISSRLSSPARLILRNRFTYELRSEPRGLVAVEGEVSPGESYTTPHLIGERSGYTFVGFTVDNEPVRDVTGYYLDRITVTPTANTEIVAHYVETGLDSDGDGIVDAIEYQHFGHLGYSRDDDPDGDGFTIGEELDIGLGLLARDEVVTGGFSARLSAPLDYDRVRSRYVRESRPLGLISSVEEMVTNGTKRTSPHLGTNSISGYVFGYWSINGERTAASDGVARRQVEVTVDGPTTVVAHFFEPSADTDEDGLEDWWEWNLFGTLEHDFDSDPDGDGTSIAEELRLGFSVVHADSAVDGGLSSRLSAPLNYETGTRKRLLVQSRPLGIITTTEEYLETGTPVTSNRYDPGNFYSGYRFVYWTRNGERVADAAGHGRTQVLFDLIEDTELVAHFTLPDEDLDEDGIPDFLELRVAEGLDAIAPGRDFDGDGIFFEEELEKGFSHVLKDEIRDGGLSARLSAPANLHFTEPPLHLKPGHLRTVRGAPAGARVADLAVSPMEAGRSYEYALVLGEGGGDNSRFSLTGGELRLASDLEDSVPNFLSARIRATDDRGVERFWKVTVQVHESLLAPLGSRVVRPEEVVEAEVRTSVPEMADELSELTMVSGPAGSRFDPATGHWSWTPSLADGPGIYEVTFRADNGLMSSERTLRVTVLESADSSAEVWLNARFTDATPPERRGLFDDANNDGVSNLMAYALGIHPESAEALAFPILTREEDGDLFLTVRARSDDPALSSGIQRSVDLSDWSYHALTFDPGQKIWYVEGPGMAVDSFRNHEADVWEIDISLESNQSASFWLINVIYVP